MENEKINLMKVFKDENGNTQILWTNDINKYEMYGFLKSYTDRLGEELKNDWKQK